jgi:phosphate:Na+ symporter
MQAIAPFLAGLGLFFCGVHFISNNLVPLAGRHFRRLLTRVWKYPWLIAVVGSFAGVVTQSANAVTSVVIGLVSGGLVDKRRAILVPTWAHVGASMLVILVAVDFRLAASYLIALTGFAVYFGFDRDDRARQMIGTLLGAGLLFLGMQMLKSGAEPLRDFLVHEGVIAEAARAPALLLLVGAGLSLVTQSSSVAGALAVAAIGGGLVDLSGAIWLVYGANLGSGANYAVLAKTHRGEASQIALMQVTQKLAGFGLLMVIMAIEYATGDRLIEGAASSLTSSMSGQVAWVFLFYQVLGSFFCTVFVAQILPALERIAPPSELQELSKPAFLIDDALVEPSFAIELVDREEHRLLSRLPTMLDGVRADVVEVPVPVSTLRLAGVAVVRAMTAYLEQISEASLERVDREKVVRMQHRAANLTALHESLEEFVAACRTASAVPTSARVAEQMIESLHLLLTSLDEASGSSDPVDRDMLLSLLGHRDELMERIRQRVLREDPDMPRAAQESLFAATMVFERVIWLARRSALLLTPESAAARNGRPAGAAS